MARRNNREELKFQTNPVHRPDYTESDVHSLRALQRGTATATQQQQALDFIINRICQTYERPWRVDSSMKDVLIGRICVGQDIVHFLNTVPSMVDPDKISLREAPTGDEA